MRKKIIFVLNILFIVLAGLEHSLEIYIDDYVFNSLLFYLENILFITGIILWYVSMKRRILDKNMNKGFHIITICLTMIIFIKVLKYRVASNTTLLRYLDYFYYVFMSLAVTEFLFLTSFPGKPVGYKPSSRWNLLYIIPVILGIMILTNDLHEMNYKIHEDKSYSLSYGQWILMGTLGIELLTSFGITVKKCFNPSFRNKIYIPLLCFMATVGGYLIGYILPDVRFPFSFPDYTAIMLITYIESFLYTGLIRSNESYKEIFKKSGLNAFITDMNYNVIYKSENSGTYDTGELKMSDENGLVKNDIRLERKKMEDSLFYYEESLKELNDIRRNLSDVLVTVEEENEILEEGQKLEKEKIRIKEELGLVSEITDIIKPSLLDIHELLKNITPLSEEYERNVSDASFIISYIKRRINMTLLSHMENMSLEELDFALNEMTNTYKLTGCDISYILDEERSKDNILDSFDYCYKILLKNMNASDAAFLSFGRELLRITIDKKDQTVIYNYPDGEGEIL